ncbi:MAG: CPBP family intramembrane glutamic endopeptidase [Nitrososphaerota archaeon]
MGAKSKYNNLPAAVSAIAAAFPLWHFIFNTDLIGGFWNRMVVSVSLLGLCAFLAEGREMSRQLRNITLRVIALGVLSALPLYTIFYGGYILFKPLLQEGASNVYLLASNVPAIQVAATLVYTSFLEEFFWRGFIQRNLTNYLGRLRGLLSATASYTLIHIFTLNLPLMLAALIAGLWWGYLYMLTGSLWLTAASHIVWTEMVILALPLG